jgi:hypothetical protein
VTYLLIDRYHVKILICEKHPENKFKEGFNRKEERRRKEKQEYYT